MPTLPLRRSRRLLGASAAVAVVAFAGAAAAQTVASPAVPSATAKSAGSTVTPDPFEGLNRKTFAFNQVLDRTLERPLAVFWHHAAPKPLRRAIDNFLTNLSEPVVLVNDVLQGRPATAAGTATRFVVNTLIGVAGIFDVAGPEGLPHHDNGFGLTLGRWGVGTGPYLYLPVLGPSTLRDGVGALADIGANPLTYTNDVIPTGASTGLGIASGLETRANADSDLKALSALSTDEYAALRSFYLQNRQAQITGGKIDLNALPDFDDPEAPAGPATTAAAPGSIETPQAAAPVAPQGDVVALPPPAPPAEPPTAPTAPPAEPKGV